MSINNPTKIENIDPIPMPEAGADAAGKPEDIESIADSILDDIENKKAWRKSALDKYRRVSQFINLYSRIEGKIKKVEKDWNEAPSNIREKIGRLTAGLGEAEAKEKEREIMAGFLASKKEVLAEIEKARQECKLMEQTYKRIDIEKDRNERFRKAKLKGYEGKPAESLNEALQYIQNRIGDLRSVDENGKDGFDSNAVRGSLKGLLKTIEESNRPDLLEEVKEDYAQSLSDIAEWLKAEIARKGAAEGAPADAGKTEAAAIAGADADKTEDKAKAGAGVKKEKRQTIDGLLIEAKAKRKVWRTQKTHTIKSSIPALDQAGLEELIAKTNEELYGLETGNYPDPIQGLVAGIGIDDVSESGKLDVFISDYQDCKKKILAAAEERLKVLRGEEKGAPEADGARDPQADPKPEAQDYRDRLNGEVEGMGTDYEKKLEEWSMEANAFVESLNDKDAGDVRSEVSRYRKKTTLMRSGFELGELEKMTGSQYARLEIGKAKTTVGVTERAARLKKIGEMKAQGLDREVPAELRDYLDNLQADDTVKRKLRDEYIRIREEAAEKAEEGLLGRIGFNADEGIKVEADPDKYLDEIEKRFHALEPKKKAGLLNKIANIGFWTSEKRSQLMGGLTGYLSELTKSNEPVSGFFKSLAEIYKEDEGKAAEAMADNKKGWLKNISGTAQGLGNLMKIGRVVYDVADGVFLRSVNPFRNATIFLMTLGRSSEAVKRTRLSGDKLKEKTRIADQEEAMEEAMRIFNINLKEDGTTYLDKEELHKKYREQLPQDLMRRIDRNGGIEGSSFIQKWFKSSIKEKAQRVLEEMDAVDRNMKLSSEAKQRERQKVLSEYAGLLQDLDKMIAHEGTVDNIAYGSRRLETASRKLSNVLMIDSAWRMAHLAFDMSAYDKAWADIKGGAIRNLKELVSVSYAYGAANPVGNDLSPEEIAGSKELAQGIAQSAVSPDMPDLTGGMKAVDEPFEAVAGNESVDGYAEIKSPAAETLAGSYVQDPPAASEAATGNSGAEPQTEKTSLETEAPAEAAAQEDSRAEDALAARSGSEEFRQQLELATIRRGSGVNSIEGVFIKQLMADPHKYGYGKDADDPDEIKAWAGRQAHVIAAQNGYFDSKTGMGVHMKGISIGHNAYVLKVLDGKIGVDEYMDGELRESKMPGDANVLDKNEYQVREKSGIAKHAGHKAGSGEIIKNGDDGKQENAKLPNRREMTPEEVNIRINNATALLAADMAGVNDDELADIDISRDKELTPEREARLKYLMGHIEDKKQAIEDIKSGKYLRPEQAGEDRASKEQIDRAFDRMVKGEAGSRPLGQGLELRESLSRHKIGGLVNDSDLRGIGIDPEKPLSAEGEKALAYLEKRSGNIQEGLEVVKLGKDLNIDFQTAQEYHSQLSGLSGNKFRQAALLNILKGNNANGNLARLFELNISDDQIKTNGTETVIKNVADGHNLVIENDAKEIKFALKKSWGLPAPMKTLTNENIDKLKAEIDSLSAD